MKNKIRGVIFDLDGTLVGSKLNFKKIRQAINCPINEDILLYVDKAEPELKRVYQEIITQHELEEAKDATWLGDAKLFIEYLEKRQIPMAIVTRNQLSAAQIKIKNNNIPISTLFTRDDAKAKPNPDALIQISKLWQLSTKDLVYVGDYKYDLFTAANADMASALLVNGKLPDYAKEATFIIRSLNELKPYIV